MPDGPPPTPEMLIAGEALRGLTAPVTQLLLDAGVDPLKAGFVALRAVQAVLGGIIGDSAQARFVLKHQSFRA